MIKIEITDIAELQKLPIVSSYDLKHYLEQTYPELWGEALELSYGAYGDVEEMLEYISRNADTDNIHEVFMSLGAGLTATYGYIID